MKIIAFGDSLTTGHPFGEESSWVKLVADRLNINIINKGVKGNTLVDMFDRFETDVLKENPDYVIVMGGTNDIVRMYPNVDRWSQLSKKNMSVMDVWKLLYGEIYLNLELIIGNLEYHNIQPIVGLPPPLDQEQLEKGLSHHRQSIVEEYGDKIPIIDFSKPFFNKNGKVISSLIPDGTHPTKEGYIKMADEAEKVLKGVLFSHIKT